MYRTYSLFFSENIYIFRSWISPNKHCRWQMLVTSTKGGALLLPGEDRKILILAPDISKVRPPAVVWDVGGSFPYQPRCHQQFYQHYDSITNFSEWSLTPKQRYHHHLKSWKIVIRIKFLLLYFHSASKLSAIDHIIYHESGAYR